MTEKTMAIAITTHNTDAPLQGKSHWWGFPDLPLGVEYPNRDGIDEDGTEDTLTFIGQINLEEIAPLDTQRLLPSKGMLYFFADLDYFLGDCEANCEGLGFWPKDAFKVIYSPTTENLNTHKVLWSDGTPACKPAQAVTFHHVADNESGHKLLGTPYFDEIAQEAAGCISLLQLDDDEDWGLELFDMGNINFLITRKALRALDFSKTELYFHSL